MLQIQNQLYFLPHFLSDQHPTFSLCTSCYNHLTYYIRVIRHFPLFATIWLVVFRLFKRIIHIFLLFDIHHRSAIDAFLLCFNLTNYIINKSIIAFYMKITSSVGFYQDFFPCSICCTSHLFRSNHSNFLTTFLNFLQTLKSFLQSSIRLDIFLQLLGFLMKSDVTCIGLRS